jgi:2-C-methyl-D-erythritol 4-phosphate cytidylyltransferase
VRVHVIIVAGGTGSRMQQAVPKQFLLLGGRPVLMHTIDAFLAVPAVESVVIAMHPSFLETWQELCESHNFRHALKVLEGGETRFDSVKRALEVIPDNVVVAIHDAVRPVVDLGLITRVLSAAAENGGAIPVTASRDSLRIRKGSGTAPILRDQVLIVQTPQAFQSELIKAAYAQEYQESFTDDATVYESTGRAVTTVDGNPDNLKITYPGDLLTAEALLLKNEKSRT